jgi:hypothetical protein
LKRSHRRPLPKINSARIFPIEIMITRAELARLDAIASEHRFSRWRVMRLALELLFIEQRRATDRPPIMDPRSLPGAIEGEHIEARAA